MPASEYDQDDDKYCVSARIDVHRRVFYEDQNRISTQSKVSVSIQTLVETVHTTGWFEMF